MKNKFFLFLAAFLYKTLIEYCYRYGVSPLFAYSGFIWNPNITYYCFSVLLLLIVIITAPTNTKKPSTYLFHLLIAFLFIPTLSYYWSVSESTTFMLLETVMILIVSLSVRIPRLKIRYLDGVGNNFFKILFLIYFFITSLLIVKRGGIDPRAFNFNDVYEIRSENNISGILGYFVNWTAKALAPFYFSYGFFYKKRNYYLIVIVLQVTMYLSFGNKAFLFSIFSMIYMYWIINRENALSKLYLSFGIINFLSVIINNFLNVSFLFRALPYRMLFVPSQIQFRYFDFFYDREKLHFAETFIGKLFGMSTGYSVPIPIVISRYFSGDATTESFANTGIFSDAFANAGVLGMIVISFIFGLILVLVDSFSLKISKSFVICSMSYLIFVINDTSLSTSLITGGLAIMLILFYLLGSHNNMVEKKGG